MDGKEKAAQKAAAHFNQTNDQRGEAMIPDNGLADYVKDPAECDPFGFDFMAAIYTYQASGGEREENARGAFMNALSTLCEGIRGKGQGYWAFPYDSDEHPKALLSPTAYALLSDRTLLSFGKAAQLQAKWEMGEDWDGYQDAVGRLQNDYSEAEGALRDGRLRIDWDQFDDIREMRRRRREAEANGTEDPEELAAICPDMFTSGKWPIRNDEDGKTLDLLPALIALDERYGEPEEPRVVGGAGLPSMFMALCGIAKACGGDSLRRILRPEAIQTVAAVIGYRPPKIEINTAFPIVSAMKSTILIANGQDTQRLQPRQGSRSNERWEVSGIPSYFKEFYSNNGANPWVLNRLLGIVSSLIKNPKTGSYIDPDTGLLYVTENLLAKELAESQDSELSAPANSAPRRIAHDAMEALSTFRIRGYGQDGQKEVSAYFIAGNYIRTLNVGRVQYNNVWELEINATPMNQYGNEIGQGYDYPRPRLGHNLNARQSSMYAYITRLLHMARPRVYNTKTKQPWGTNAEWRIQPIKWETIFAEFSPMNHEALDPKTKRRIVKEFEEVLADIAEKEYEDRYRPGMPLYITASTTLDAKRGGGNGGGAWDYVEIVCSAKKHRPSVSLMAGKKEEGKKAKSK